MKLALGRALYDPSDPMGKLSFNILATFAEFEADLIRMRTREGMAIARARGKLRGKQPKLSNRQQRELCRMPCHRRVFHQRSRQALLRIETNRLWHTQPASFPLAYDPAPYRNRPDHVHILEMNGESYRLKRSRQNAASPPSPEEPSDP